MHREESQLATKQQTTRLNLLSATPPLFHITSPQTIAISILASFINVALYLLLSTNSPTCVVKMGLRFQLLSRFIYGESATIMGRQLKICYPSAPPPAPLPSHESATISWDFYPTCQRHYYPTAISTEPPPHTSRNSMRRKTPPQTSWRT